MFEALLEASHVVAGMGVTLDEALEIVKAAHEVSTVEPDQPTAGNVVYGVDFRRR